MAGSVIQATGMVEFEDGLWIGNHLKTQNGLQRVLGSTKGGLHTWAPPRGD